MTGVQTCALPISEEEVRGEDPGFFLRGSAFHYGLDYKNSVNYERQTN